MKMIKTNTLSFLSLCVGLSILSFTSETDAHAHPSGRSLRLLRQSRTLEQQTQNESERTGNRRAHARELVGSSYPASTISAGEKFPDLSAAVQLLVQSHLPTRWKKYSHKMSAAVVAQSAKNHMDPLFLLAVIQNESNFNPIAKGSQGEIGLMQLMPETAKWISAKFSLGYRSPSQLNDPVMNIKLGAAYLSYLRERFDHQSRLYLAAYNMGSKKLHRSLAAQHVPQKYSNQVMTHYLKYYSQLLTLDVSIAG